MSAIQRSAEGAAVVLLHPLALSGELWQSWREELAPEWRVETPDAPGHGARQWNGKPWTIWDAASEIREALSADGIERAHVVGASMGGCVALALGCQQPSWVASLVLLDTTAWYGETASTDWAARAERALGPRHAQLAWQLDRWFSPGYVADGGPSVGIASSIFLRTAGAAHAAACRALGVFDAREAARDVVAPTLVMTGEHDEATPPRMGEDLQRRIPGATFRVVAGGRHFCFLEAREVLDAVVEHLRAVDRQKSPGD